MTTVIPRSHSIHHDVSVLLILAEKLDRFVCFAPSLSRAMSGSSLSRLLKVNSAPGDAATSFDLFSSIVSTMALTIEKISFAR